MYYCTVYVYLGSRYSTVRCTCIRYYSALVGYGRTVQRVLVIALHAQESRSFQRAYPTERCKSTVQVVGSYMYRGNRGTK